MTGNRKTHTLTAGLVSSADSLSTHLIHKDRSNPLSIRPRVVPKELKRRRDLWARTGRGSAMSHLVLVRLTRKHAEIINGIDLSGYIVGDRLRVSPREAALLIAEGWALPEGNSAAEVGAVSTDLPREDAADVRGRDPQGT